MSIINPFEDKVSEDDTIPEELAMRVIAFQLLLGPECNIVKARKLGEDRILLWYIKDGIRFCVSRDLVNTSNVSLPSKSQESFKTFVHKQATKADILTSSQGKKLYNLLNSDFTPTPTHSQNNAPKLSAAKSHLPWDLRESPDEISTVKYQHYLQICEKHTIKMG